MALPIAQSLLRKGAWRGAAERVTLDYEARFLRRKKLVTEGGEAFVVDLEQTTSLEAGDALQMADGRLVEIVAAEEPCLIVTGESLARLAWHIGNRHTPCQVEAERLVIRDDKVIAHMLAHLGAEVVPAMLPFTPEGGAYGHGRTHAHEHGKSAHDHDHGHGHAHDHDHAHG